MRVNGGRHRVHSAKATEDSLGLPLSASPSATNDARRWAVCGKYRFPQLHRRRNWLFFTAAGLWFLFLCWDNGDSNKVAKPVLLAKIDVSNGHRYHPHKGARDADGTFGYVPDPTRLHKAPPPIKLYNNCTALRIHDPTFLMLTKRVKVNLEEHERREREVAQGIRKARVKLLCIIYSFEPRHGAIQDIRETWGHKCDGFLVASNKTEASLDIVDTPHDGGPEEYEGMWQKVRSMWSFVYDNYYDDFDWFHMGGDDMYVIVENLRLYLESDHIQKAATAPPVMETDTDDETENGQRRQMPLYLGRKFALEGDMSDIYAAGGPGYTLNKAALKALVVDGLPYYHVHKYWFAEDAMVGRTFRELGIYPFDTTDETGADRYHHFDPGYHYMYQGNGDWFQQYAVNSILSVNGTSVYSVTFHYIKHSDYLRRIHALLYPKTHSCPLVRSS